MKDKKILTRDNIPTNELKQIVEREYKGVVLTYTEYFYLDYAVDEETGMIDKENKIPYYTKGQTTRNLKSQKNAYLIAKGAASPNEIADFREKYKIPASSFSVILGFSKNTISNIEKEGVTSLPSGRLIKVCLTHISIFSEYVETCSKIGAKKKKELLERLTPSN